ncbi:MAG TPA: DUF6691 family protein [Solirubrobacteraceae bacterium]|nr:DUF6691 family protein [Solirubrobacteraceae bacterium]
MRVRAAACLLGIAFGFMISWGQFSDPERIRQMLLLEDPYMYLMMGSSIAVAMLGLRVLRARRARALITGAPVTIATQRPERRHFVGAAIFGVGWAIADSCPGPIAAQLSQGVAWSAFTAAGVLCGVWLYLRRQDRLSLTQSRLRRRGPASGSHRPTAAPSVPAASGTPRVSAAEDLDRDLGDLRRGAADPHPAGL